MKKINIMFIIASLLVGVASCDSLLDVQIQHALSQAKVKTPEGCESLLIGVYDLLQDASYAGRDLIAVPEVMADNAYPSPSSTLYIGHYNFKPYSNIDIWESAYRQIGAVNEALLYLKDMEQTNKVKAITGEAYFLRAYNYFNLALVYSRMPNRLVDNFDLCVPLITLPFFNQDGNISTEACVPRAKVDVIWAQIVDDLNKSFLLLDNNDAGKAPYRISALASKALLSRVYLYKSDWANAVTAAEYVISKSAVQMYDGNYTDIFSKGTESLWQLHYTLGENLASSSLHSTFGTMDNGIIDSEGYGDGTGAGDAQLSVSDDFISSMDTAVDKRFTALRKVRYYGQKLWWTTKYNSWGGTFGLDDVPLIRISEVYLNLAEAYAQQNNYIKARENIDLLRNKRGIGNATATDTDLLDEILLQRRIELAFEGHRFFDLKRLGKPITRANEMTEIPYNDYRVVAPIATKEMDVNQCLVNNPGY